MFTVATSIAPKGLELQRKAIASWLRLGFAVISFNNTAEVELLAPQFPEVRFVTVARDGLLYDGQQLGLRTTIDRAELAARFGNPASGATFPAPPPPRPRQAPAPRSSTP